MSDYTLAVRSRVNEGLQQVAELTGRAIAWHRSIRLQGGPWQGGFMLQGSVSELEEIFYSWLGHDLRERAGGDITWEGLIYEMELTVNGRTRRRSLDLMFNSVQAAYIDDANNRGESSWYEQASSIGIYGRRRESVTLDGHPVATAEARAQQFLAERAWPWARTVSAAVRSQEPQLQVTACGYGFTANWKFVTVNDGATGNLSVWLKDIIDTDCEFLDPGSIEANTYQVKRKVQTARRVWDQLEELVDLGDSQQRPYRLYVEPGRRVSYSRIDMSNPAYYWRGDGLHFQSGGQAAESPWLVKPGLVRDMTSLRRSGREPGSLFEDPRDFLVGEVEAGERSGLSLKPADLLESDMVAAQAEFAEWQSELRL